MSGGGAAKSVLALDFDGVLWDSAGECFEVGWRAYRELFGSDLSSAAFKERFLAGRPLARTGEDFYLLLHWLEQQPELCWSSYGWADLEQARVSQAEPAHRFTRAFYALRAHFREREPALWNSWQGPYTDVLALLRSRADQFSGVAIATTKDTVSASALLESSDCRWPVFGKEFSLRKDQQIAAIAQRFEVAPEQVSFLDDVLENLEQVAPTGARVALASWGYTTEESCAAAQRFGFEVLRISDLEAWLDRRTGAERR